MRLIAISLPEFHSDEARQITRLLADGAFWRVHLRKPGAKPDDLRRLLDSVPAELYPRLSLHDFFDIAEERSLGGVHLNSRNPDAPAGWTGMTSRSCHSTAELKEHAGLDYLFLSPVFDSISKPGYHSAFSLDSLHASGLLGPNIFALGGVTPERLPALADAGFGGAAMLGAAWNFPEEKNQDEKQKNMLQFITHTIEGLDDVLRGGCRWVQLRMKDASDEEFIATALRTSEICRRYNATFIVDDRIHLAKTVGADGVHLGKKDMPLPEARAILGDDLIIGATANTLDDIRSASAAGADYIGLGPFRFTTTKKGLAPLLGLDGYTRLMAAARAEGITLPVVAIGGITVADLPELRRTGVSGVAVSGLILTADDKESITKKILESWIN